MCCGAYAQVGRARAGCPGQVPPVRNWIGDERIAISGVPSARGVGGSGTLHRPGAR
jgi:hypothetical protein